MSTSTSTVSNTVVSASICTESIDLLDGCSHLEFLNRCCWIFDLDGTLTRPVHDFEQMRQALGMAPGADILATLAATPEPQHSELAAQLDQLEMHYAGLAQPADGVAMILEYLHQRGCQLGILTRNKREIALHSLQVIGVAHLFDPQWVLGRDEARPKPDPHGIEYLLDGWGAAAEQTVMVGDFRFDLEVGRAAGTATVHVTPADTEQWPELTDLHVHSLDELHRLMQK
ncbi:MAG: HAD family hydrolase [Marinobacterium sp.]|nr:HAD family hydrolase [Marinobacterium sp.]